MSDGPLAAKGVEIEGLVAWSGAESLDCVRASSETRLASAPQKPKPCAGCHRSQKWKRARRCSLPTARPCSALHQLHSGASQLRPS